MYCETFPPRAVVVARKSAVLSVWDTEGFRTKWPCALRVVIVLYTGLVPKVSKL